MNPLVEYFLSVLKAEASTETRRYLDHEEALIELGYWLLVRPAHMPLESMTPCGISTDCRLVEEFRSRMPPIFDSPEFDIMVEVYEDTTVCG